MFSKSALKIAALSMALFGLTACETFATKADEAPNIEQSSATAGTQQATVVPVLVKRHGENALEIYVGSADAKKTDKEQRLKAGDVHYYTNGIILKREDIQNAFVAKTMNDQPALALRLKPDSTQTGSICMGTINPCWNCRLRSIMIFTQLSLITWMNC